MTRASRPGETEGVPVSEVGTRRVAPLAPHERDQRQAALVAQAGAEFGVYTTLVRNADLFADFLPFGRRLLHLSTLDHRVRELLILRVAHLRGCAYEFEHHVRLSKRAGVTSEDIERIKGSADAWHGRDRALLTAVDALITDRDLDDATWKQLREFLDEAETIEFLLLVGHYDMLATFLGTLRIEPDKHR